MGKLAVSRLEFLAQHMMAPSKEVQYSQTALDGSSSPTQDIGEGSISAITPRSYWRRFLDAVQLEEADGTSSKWSNAGKTIDFGNDDPY